MEPRFLHFSPILSSRELEADVAYYTEVLDFAVAWRFGDPTDRVGIARDGCELQLVTEGVAPDDATRVYFVMEGVDEYYAACVERGADVVMELADKPFGLRDFRVRDRSGNVLGFGEPLDSSR